MLNALLDRLFKKSSEVRVSCLGGAGEIGMNLYVYEAKTSAIIVDYGIMFADSSMPGIDSIYPDPHYLEGIKDKVAAIIFTHGHEDHIGGVSALVANISAPIYTGRFTAELLRHKAERIHANLDIHEVHDGQVIEAGAFAVEFIAVPHSIPDTFALRLSCGQFSAIHASDFRLDGNLQQLIKRFAEPVCLLIDSTNADGVAKTNKLTEAEVYNELLDIFHKADGRIFITTFASNVQRLASAVEAAKAAQRKIVLEGAAMERTIGIAMRLGLINIAESDIVSSKNARNAEPNSLVYLVSGCQGEYTSALHSIATGERKAVHMLEGDTLIFSSRTIPGNERSINDMINNAMHRDVDVIQAKHKPVHVSGHIAPAELQELIAAVRPEWLIPIHGEYMHLRANIRLAQSAGIDKDHCLLMESGMQLVFEGCKFIERREIPHGRIYADISGIMIDEQGLSMRRQIAHNGVVILLVNDANIAVKTYGFELESRLEQALIAAIAAREQEDSVSDAEMMKRIAKRFFRKQMDRRPYIDIVECREG
ncbi:MAG: ribonuclease J [Deferribacteraceae bacterium]|jgi:ribonuclease J|nr:ribonuclease J [Deferribacteraceae bacterium]